ncbi:hypothetical protein [Haloferax gibbonsii]|uniref:hypothetical protein n=1 Tax=Haloferax gibbonsii TaxID=35746 RepID=UPI000A78C57A|nr:hypothetical protein [Haloferax gibbonsii]
MELLRESLPDRGLAVRIVVDAATAEYRVEYTSLSSGVVTDEWTVFGGSVGYDASVFATDAAARAHDEALFELVSSSTSHLWRFITCLYQVQTGL